jgi:hypothetical protein
MSTTAKVQLVVDNFGGDASAITQLIGLEPTAIGVPEGGALNRSGQGASWIFEISMPETESVEGQALALLRFLESHAEQIRQAATRYPASIAIGIHRRDPADADELSLVPLIVADISKLGLGMHIHYSL